MHTKNTVFKMPVFCQQKVCQNERTHHNVPENMKNFDREKLSK